MNLLQLILKNMRQRALSSWLTTVSVLLGVALATAVLIVQRHGDELFVQTDYGYDLLVGPKGSRLNLVLNSAYGIGTAQGVIPWRTYSELEANQQARIRWAIPFAVGDFWKGFRIMATSTEMFGLDARGQKLPDNRTFQYRPESAFRLAQGSVFHPEKFEGVLGATAAQRLNLKLGDTFQMMHGGLETDIHDETWKVVGILEPTQTAFDETIFIPLISNWAVPAHADAMEAIAALDPEVAATMPAEAIKDGHDHDHDHDHDHGPSTAPADAHDDHDHAAHDDHADHSHNAAAEAAHAKDDHGHDHGHDHDHDHGPKPYHMHGDLIHLDLPESDWKISGIFVRTRGGVNQPALQWTINNGRDAMALNPAGEMRSFFNTFLAGGTTVLLGLAILVSIVAAISILVSIYNSVAARRREIAILRALGATRGKILTLICLEAALIGLIGAVLGLILGLIVANIGAEAIRAWSNTQLTAMVIGTRELLYAGGVVVLALLAGLVPALKAYKTPVADNLVLS